MEEKNMSQGMTETEDVPEVLIRCDGLVKIYKTEDLEVVALQGLNLEVRKGEMLAIIGKSGSGKTTLMNMIGGLERPSAGRLYVSGQNLYRFNDKELVNYRNKKVGFVWQNVSRNLLPYLTALENIEVPMYFNGMSSAGRKKRAVELLESVDMLHRREAYPAQLSGGEQQRIAIAVALANEPEILLADEPTGAVDSQTAGRIQDLFHDLNKRLGITIILVTHDIRLADKMKRVVMISDGRISTEQIQEE